MTICSLSQFDCRGSVLPESSGVWISFSFVMQPWYNTIFKSHRVLRENSHKMWGACSSLVTKGPSLSCG